MVFDQEKKKHINSLILRSHSKSYFITFHEDVYDAIENKDLLHHVHIHVASMYQMDRTSELLRRSEDEVNK